MSEAVKITIDDLTAAAAELRRLHALNAELLEALRKIASTDYRGNQSQEIAIARAALAKIGERNV